MTRNEIAAAIEKCPGLNAFGIGSFRGVPTSDRLSQMEADRQELLNDTDGCTRAASWLSEHEKLKTVGRGRSSYGLKHIASLKVGYLTNGAFIAAAVHLGFPWARLGSGPNVGIGISERSLRRTGEQETAV
jgi:hypothetical protein